MSNQQSTFNFLVDKIYQLQDHQKTLAKYIVEIKCRLDSLTEQFNNRPEIKLISTLENALAALHQQLYQRSIFPEPQLEILSLETGAVDLEDIK